MSSDDEGLLNAVVAVLVHRILRCVQEERIAGEQEQWALALHWQHRADEAWQIVHDLDLREAVDKEIGVRKREES